MKTIITGIICVSLLLLPAQRVQALWAQLVVATVIVAVVGTTVYVVHTVNEASKDKCLKCGEEVPDESESCPGCGTAFRCADCNTELPEDAGFCPACGTKVPPPQPVMTSVQMSVDGTDWQTLVPACATVYSGIQIKAFASEAEYQQWLAGQNVKGVTSVPAGAQGFFRLGHK